MQKIRQVGAELLRGKGQTLFAILGTRPKSILITGILNFLIILCFVTDKHPWHYRHLLSKEVIFLCFVCVCVCVCVCVYVCMYTCVGVCVYYIYIQTHTHARARFTIQRRKRKIRDRILTSFPAFTNNRSNNGANTI